MTTIWKFPFEIQERVEIEVPDGTRLLHVGLDPDKQICAWCLVVDTEAPKTKLVFWVRGTGFDIEYALVDKYFSSFVHGPYVWHVFAKA